MHFTFLGRFFTCKCADSGPSADAEDVDNLIASTCTPCNLFATTPPPTPFPPCHPLASASHMHVSIPVCAAIYIPLGSQERVRTQLLLPVPLPLPVCHGPVDSSNKHHVREAAADARRELRQARAGGSEHGTSLLHDTPGALHLTRHICAASFLSILEVQVS